MTDQPLSKWKRGVDLAKDIGDYAKLVALCLTIIGFVAAYLPSARRQFELVVNPSAWFFIGGIYGDKFGHNDYQNPLWDDGAVPRSVLDALPGNIMVATVSSEPHNGRETPGPDGILMTVAPDNSCLYVREVRILKIPKPKSHGPQSAAWARAQRVAC